MDEIARVLAPEGVLILSCPNKREYTDRRGYTNEFHVKELYREELAVLVARRFPQTAWFGQRLTFFSVLAPEAPASAGQVIEVAEAAPSQAAPGVGEPLYFLVAAARSAQALARVPAMLSVLTDRDDWLRADYEKVTRDLWRSAEMVRERDKVMQQMRAALDEADASARRHEEERARQFAAMEQTVQRGERAQDEFRQEIRERYRWKWWLMLPLIRLGLMKLPRVRK